MDDVVAITVVHDRRPIDGMIAVVMVDTVMRTNNSATVACRSGVSGQSQRGGNRQTGKQANHSVSP